MMLRCTTTNFRIRMRNVEMEVVDVVIHVDEK